MAYKVVVQATVGMGNIRRRVGVGEGWPATTRVLGKEVYRNVIALHFDLQNMACIDLRITHSRTKSHPYHIITSRKYS